MSEFQDTKDALNKSEYFSVDKDDKKLEGKVISWSELNVKGPDSAKFSRDVIRHPGAVGIVAIDEDFSVYLVRQYRASIDAEIWEIPAGKRDVDGEDPKETALRELTEEVGVKAEDLQHLLTHYVSPGFTDELCYIYLAEGLSNTDQALDGPEEQKMIVDKVPLVDAVKAVIEGKIVDGKSQAALMAAYLKLFESDA